MPHDERLSRWIAECRRRRAAGTDAESLAAWLRETAPQDLAAEDILRAALGAEGIETGRPGGRQSPAPAADPGPQPLREAPAAGPARTFGRRPDVMQPAHPKADGARDRDRQGGSAPAASGGRVGVGEAPGDGMANPPAPSEPETAAPAAGSFEAGGDKPDDGRTGAGDSARGDRAGDDGATAGGRQPEALDSVPVRGRGEEPPSLTGQVPFPRRRETEAEMAQAARRLGIRFRDAEDELIPDVPDTGSDEVARKLGIRFRDDGPGWDPEAGTDLSLEAERLGIRFRDPGKLPKSGRQGVAKYWFWVLLALALAIIMPVLVQAIGPFVAYISG